MSDTVDKAEAWDAVAAANKKHIAEIEDLKAENERYVIWSHEHSAWWRPNSAGYCRDVRGAGIYTRDEALSISHDGVAAGMGEEIGMRRCELEHRISPIVSPSF